MYIRIQDHSIRYRISKAEAEQLISGDKLIKQINFSPNFCLSYSLTTTAQKSTFNYLDDKSTLHLNINEKELISEIEGRPTKSGIAVKHSTLTSGETTAYLEVDLKRRKT